GPEFYVVGRISIEEIISLDRDPFEVSGREFTVAENAAIAAEIAPIVDPFVSAKWDVELPAQIEATKGVLTGAVQKIKERGRRGRASSAIGNKLFEALTMLVVEGLPVVKFEP